jgi:MFS family permease
LTPPQSFANDRRYQRLLLLIVMLAVTAFGSLMTLITVALDDIGADLGASRVTMTWAITGLMLTMAVATPTAGTLGDVHGHRKILLIGLIGGAVSTLLCGLAWNAASLIGFRVLFGLFGACVNPNAISLMMHAYGPERRATAVGWFQFAVTGAPTIGLVAGGPLIDAAGWRVVFFAFAGVSLVAFAVGLPFLRPIPRQEGRQLDIKGAVTLASGVLAVLLAITEVLRGPGLLLVTYLLAASIAFTLFVHIERTVAAPMLKLDYFRRRNFTMPLLSAAAMQFAYMGGFVITPALLSRRYGWATGAIALLMMPRPGAFSIASLAGGWLPHRIGFRWPVVLGTIFMSASMILFAFAAPTSGALGITLIVGGLVLSGVASGVSQPAIATLAVNSVDEGDIGIANGMNQQMTFVGIVAGIQTMNVLVGDSDASGRFVSTYLVGLGAALIGLVAAWRIKG